MSVAISQISSSTNLILNALIQMAAPEVAAPEVAAPDVVVANGPAQHGRGQPGQYVYLIVFSHPTPDAIQRLGLKTPAEFTKPQFRQLALECHEAHGVELVETAGFVEPRADGLPHLNLLVRAQAQYRWKKPAEEFRKRGVHVDFAPNIKTWADGVVYLQVASEHKPPETLDRNADQWVKEGQPVPLKEFLPRRWQGDDVVRKTRLSSLAFFDLCKRHRLFTVEALWAKATELSEAGDRGLLAYLLDNDGEGQFAKVLKALGAQERQRRAKLTREALLEEHLQTQRCICASEGFCYTLMKDLLRKNGLDGQLQADVLGALRAGRAKKRTVCLLGDANCGKSFLLKGLKEVFHTYERPDGGTHQLEDLLDKELVVLNDFEFDAKAKEWMSWQYFKNFLEGGSIPVARPKNRGGNQLFEGSAPVLMTAPQPVTLARYGREVVKERAQMEARILYRHFQYSIPEDERQEVTRHCGHCSARLYLEGRAWLDGGRRASAPAVADGPANLSAEPAPKRQRTAQECLAELRELKELLDGGLLTTEEFADLKKRLLEGS
jgi:hypothetical protein